MLSGEINGRDAIKLINGSKLKFAGSHGIGTKSVVMMVIKPVRIYPTAESLNTDYVTTVIVNNNSNAHILFNHAIPSGGLALYAGAVLDSNARLSKNQASIVIARFNESNSSIRINGSVVATGDAGYASWTYGLQIGETNYGGTSDAIYAEVAVIAGASDVATIEKVEGYWAHQYGLAASLPAGHPYKASPP